MFLFELNLDSANPRMIVYLPTVPPAGGDPGHFYAANGKNSQAGMLNLDGEYTLERPTTAAAKPGGIDDNKDVVLHKKTCGLKLKGDGWSAKITMPVPDEYEGWRMIGADKPIMYSSNSCIHIPASVYQTCVFHYKNPGGLMIKKDGKQFWPRTGNALRVLHLFAAPKHGPQVRARNKEPGFMAHGEDMDSMFSPALDLHTATGIQLCVTENAAPFGLKRQDLIEIGEPADLGVQSCPSQAPDKLKVAGMASVTRRIVAGNLVDCHSVFLIND
jgi:hypothetical protein